MKRIAAAAFAALITAGTVLQSAPASAGQGRHDSREAAIAAGILGAAAGLIVGSAVAGNPQPPVIHRHYVVPKTPARHYRPKPPVQRMAKPWSREWYRYCIATFRSFNPKTGTYRGYDGRLHFCEAPLNPRRVGLR